MVLVDHNRNGIPMARRVITVFGGSGFLGRALVQRLAREGDTVRVAIRDPESALSLKLLGDVGQIVPWPADIGNKESVARAAQGANAVVNLVGILYQKRSRTFRQVHVDGAANIAEAAAAAGVERLVHVSAIGADKNSPAVYAQTKAQGEEAVRRHFADATVVRPSVVFGPDDHFFNLFAAISRFTPVLPVYGGGEGPKMQPVYVADVAKAVAQILNDPATKGKTYELGGPRAYSFRRLMELMLAVTGRRRWLVPFPFALAALQAWFLEWSPKPLLTRDQVKLLTRDNVVSPDALKFADLGIQPEPAEAILPTYLHRFRRQARHTRALA